VIGRVFKKLHFALPILAVRSERWRGSRAAAPSLRGA
jgi:hypothetical protein